MEKFTLDYPCNDNRLKPLVSIEKSANRQHEVGTAFLPAGCRMPDHGTSAHPRHEVSIILEGTIHTYSDDEMYVLRTGDIISIPEGENQRTEVIEDTKLIYVFFDK